VQNLLKLNNENIKIIKQVAKKVLAFYYEKGGDILKLVLCEKPSVGNTVAKVLGVKSRKAAHL
jgi:hypothetical protein